MSSTQATRNDDGAELSNRTFATYMVIEEHERLAKSIMALVDLIGGVQDRSTSVNVANLRKATARTLYESRRNLTDGLLFAVALDDGPLDEKVIDAIAENGDECGKQFERVDAEIKAEKGEDR